MMGTQFAKPGESSMEKKIGEHVLPFKLGLKSGHNGCNVYDANDNQVCCSLGLLLHQTIQEIREFAKTSPIIEKELEFADYLINALNSHDALLAACKLAADQAGRASLVQDRSVGIIKATCAIIEKDLKSAIKAGEDE